MRASSTALKRSNQAGTQYRAAAICFGNVRESKTMDVILREDIEKLGTRGQVVKVAPGYARNFLLPKRLAVVATESNKKIVDQERDAHLRRDAKLQSEASDLGRLLSAVTVTIRQKAGEEGHLFGS